MDPKSGRDRSGTEEHRERSRQSSEERTKSRSRGKRRSRERSPRRRSHKRSRSRSSRRKRSRSARSRRHRSRSKDRGSHRSGSSRGAGFSNGPSVLQQQMAAANPQLTRQARRLYVGNLPVGMGLTEPILTQFFNSTVVAVGIATPDPVLSTWMSSEGTFCFVELRAVEDCTSCVTLLEGLQLGGRTLRFGRPADYQPPPPHLTNFVVGGVEGEAPPEPQRADTTALSSNPPTKVLLLTNMVTAEDVNNDDEYADLVADIRSECSNFGALVNVVLPRGEEKGVGLVFLEYDDSGGAEKAKKALDGRAFASNKIQATFYDVDKYLAGDF